MSDMNKYILYGVAALVVLGAIWFYMSQSGETPTASPPATQQTPAK